MASLQFAGKRPFLFWECWKGVPLKSTSFECVGLVILTGGICFQTASSSIYGEEKPGKWRRVGMFFLRNQVLNSEVVILRYFNILLNYRE